MAIRNWFTKPAETKLQGMTVSINEGGKTPAQRYERASNRVYALTKKLRNLQARPNGCKQMIAQTELAIDEWSKRARIAKFEIDIAKGNV